MRLGQRIVVFSCMNVIIVFLSQAQLLIAPQSIQDFRLVNDDILPELRQLLRVDANQKVQDRITYLLDQLAELCVVTGDCNGEIEPIDQNQVMLDNLGEETQFLLIQNACIFFFFTRNCVGDPKLCSIQRK